MWRLAVIGVGSQYHREAPEGMPKGQVILGSDPDKADSGRDGQTVLLVCPCLLRYDLKPQDDLFLKLLRRFQEEGVEYLLVGSQAVRLNGFLRATEVVDVLLKTKTDYREKDVLDKSVLQKLR